MLKGYVLHSLGSEGFPDAVIVAESLERAIEFLGAELQEQVHETKWSIVFPVTCFQSPTPGSKEEKDTAGMWVHRISSQTGRDLIIYWDWRTEVGVAYFLEELPLLIPSST